MMVLRFMPYLCAVLYPLAAQCDANINWQLKRDKSGSETALSIPLAENIENRDKFAQLLFEVDIRVEHDKVVERVRRAWYFNDSDAIQTYGSDTISFNELTDTITVTEAVTLHPGAPSDPFDPANAETIDSDTYHVFTNNRELVISFPALKPGSIALLEYERVTDRTQLEAGWSRTVIPQNLYPRKKFALTVQWPANGMLTWSAGSKHAHCEIDGQTLSCIGQDIPPAATDSDVLWLDELGQIIISDSNRWPDVTSRLSDSFTSALESSAVIDNLVAKLTENAKTPEEKISRVHKFVARNIRYVSMSKNGHSTIPHKISDTVKNRFGDCKDKSALLVALLARIGIEATPTLVATDRLDPFALRVPSAAYFDHMVVCFRHSGSPYCFDTTDSYTDWRATPAGIQGKVSLALKPSGIPRKITSSRYRWQIDVETDVTFTRDGGQRETQTRHYRSAYAGRMRSVLAGKGEEDIGKWMLNEYQEVVSNQAEPVFTTDNPDELGESFKVLSNSTYEPFISIEENLSHAENDAWVRYLINSLKLENTTYDSNFSGLHVSSEYKLDISSRWMIDGLNATLDLRHEYGTMTRLATKESDGVVRVVTEIEIPERKISIAATDEFNEFLDILKRESVIRVYGKLK